MDYDATARATHRTYLSDKVWLAESLAVSTWDPSPPEPIVLHEIRIAWICKGFDSMIFG